MSVSCRSRLGAALRRLPRTGAASERQARTGVLPHSFPVSRFPFPVRVSVTLGSHTGPPSRRRPPAPAPRWSTPPRTPARAPAHGAGRPRAGARRGDEDWRSRARASDRAGRGAAARRPRARTRVGGRARQGDRKSTRLNSSHDQISYAVFCLKKKKKVPVEALAAGHLELDGRLRCAYVLAEDV